MAKGKRVTALGGCVAHGTLLVREVRNVAGGRAGDRDDDVRLLDLPSVQQQLSDVADGRVLGHRAPLRRIARLAGEAQAAIWCQGVVRFAKELHLFATRVLLAPPQVMQWLRAPRVDLSTQLSTLFGSTFACLHFTRDTKRIVVIIFSIRDCLDICA